MFNPVGMGRIAAPQFAGGGRQNNNVNKASQLLDVMLKGLQVQGRNPSRSYQVTFNGKPYKVTMLVSSVSFEPNGFDAISADGRITITYRRITIPTYLRGSEHTVSLKYRNADKPAQNFSISGNHRELEKVAAELKRRIIQTAKPLAPSEDLGFDL